MSVFDNVNTAEDVKDSGDSIGSNFNPVETNVYPATIKLAYVSESLNKATALNVEFETEDKSIVRQQFWISSNKSKGCKNYYIDKQGDKQYLPGFNQANALAMLTVGKPLLKLDSKKVVIDLYDFNAKATVPTKVDMLTDLLETKILIGVFKQVVNKRKKNEATGNYEAVDETRTENEVDKFFRMKDGLTVTEIRAGATEPGFQNKWIDKWAGKTRDRTVKVINKAKQGSPAANKAAATTSDEDLFA